MLISCRFKLKGAELCTALQVDNKSKKAMVALVHAAIMVANREVDDLNKKRQNNGQDENTKEHKKAKTDEKVLVQ